MNTKTISLFALAMLVSAPAFADQDVADVYANQGAIASNSLQATIAPQVQQELTLASQAQSPSATEQLAKLPASTSTDTGPYVDDNAIN